MQAVQARPSFDDEILADLHALDAGTFENAWLLGRAPNLDEAVAFAREVSGSSRAAAA